jgi:valyl-tRNA synthetase
VKKLRVQQGENAREHVVTLLKVFEYALRMLHPVMPFLTEELWQRLVKQGARIPETISLAAYPRAAGAVDEAGAAAFELLKEMVTAARALRADNKIDPGVKVDGCIEAVSERAMALATTELAVVDALAHGTFRTLQAGEQRPAGARRTTVEYAVTLALSSTQVEAIRQRLEKRVAELEKVIGSSHRQLASENFVAKAPEHVIASIREKLASYESELAGQQAALVELGA